MAEEKIEVGVDQEIEALEKRNAEVIERVNQLDILHEDVIIINRHDNDVVSFLALDELNREGRRRSSWYGTVIKVTGIDCGDDVREKKKKEIKSGDVIIFNPESAYSLNIAKYPEIWILHIDSVLMRDRGFNYLEAKKENIKKLHEIKTARMSQMGATLIRPIK